ncbi:MAG: S8/S53 family peptidase [bacterium]|nr:S8/S53 family peptidase [bacterium]
MWGSPEAIKKGVIVVFVEHSFNGCAYSWSGDRDKTCDVWSTFKTATEPMPKNLLYIPCENLTTAAGFGDNDYTFWGKGGISWAVPVLAGVITLGLQVDPTLSPKEILGYIKESCTPFQGGWLLNPIGFIDKIKNIQKK